MSTYEAIYLIIASNMLLLTLLSYIDRKNNTKK